MTDQIRVRGHPGRQQADRFEELCIMLKDYGSTLLTGPVVGHSARNELMRKMRDLRIVLRSVNAVDTSTQDSSEGK